MRTLLIGDVHGCLEELQELIARFGPEPGDSLLFIGDLIDKGPDSAGVLRYVRSLSETFRVELVLGNHEEKFLRYREHLSEGTKALHQMARTEEFPELLQHIGPDEIALLEKSYFTLFLPSAGLLLLHGGIPGSCRLDLKADYPYLGDYEPDTQKQLRLLTMTRYLNAKGNFVGLGQENETTPFWAETYDGRFGKVIFGHHPFLQEGPMHFPHAIGIDNGCVFGGWLSACILREDGTLEPLSVKAKQIYRERDAEKNQAKNTQKAQKAASNTSDLAHSILVIPAAIGRDGDKLAAALKISPLRTDNPTVVDSTKYHPFVKDHYIGSRESTAFLHHYALDLNQKYKTPEGKEVSFSRASGDMAIPLSNSENSTMRFAFKNISFFHNPQAGLGYFALELQWLESDLDTLLTNLERTDFFRFVGAKCTFYRSRAPRPDIPPTDVEAAEPWAFKDRFLATLFPDFHFLKKDAPLPSEGDPKDPRVPVKLLNAEKPTVLHLFRPPDDYDTTALHRKAYHILRVGKRNGGPIQGDESKVDAPELISSILLDQAIGLYLMNEGALVMDKNEKVSALVNKYFPTFLLTINQRQILVHMMEQIAGVPPHIGDEQPGGTAAQRRQAREKAQRELQALEGLRTRIIKMQLKQIFYSISPNSELNLFLAKLQERFRISQLLRDIKESIGELHQLLEANQEREQWLREKHREIAINLVGLAISAFGVISTLDTILLNNQASALARNISYGVVLVLSAVLAVYFWRRR